MRPTWRAPQSPRTTRSWRYEALQALRASTLMAGITSVLPGGNWIVVQGTLRGKKRALGARGRAPAPSRTDRACLSHDDNESRQFVASRDRRRSGKLAKASCFRLSTFAASPHLPSSSALGLRGCRPGTPAGTCCVDCSISWPRT